MELTKILGIMFVPIILFLTVVLPTWLRLHYKEKGRQSRELSQGELTEFEETLKKAELMEQRISTLEKILDESNSNWRDSL